jgi:FKBP-type peptidyl-prolyl cis-trans isomerase FklB
MVKAAGTAAVALLFGVCAIAGASAAGAAPAQSGAAQAKSPRQASPGAAAGQGSAAQENAPGSAVIQSSTVQTQSGSAGAQSGALSTEKQKESYALGMNIARQMEHQPVELDMKALVEGLQDELAGGKMLLTDEEAGTELKKLSAEAQANAQMKQQQAAEENMKEGEAFLAENKTKAGVVALPSGLQYKIEKAGTGPKPTASDTVVCNYRGTFIDGKEFDSSYKRGQPATFPVGGVIKGWTEALQMMPVGSKWELFIPSDLAYGPRGAGDVIGPNATLIFEVELMSIKGK